MSIANRAKKIKPTKFVDWNRERGRALVALSNLRGVEVALRGDPLVSSIHRQQWRHVIKVVADGIETILRLPGTGNGARLTFESENADLTVENSRQEVIAGADRTGGLERVPDLPVNGVEPMLSTPGERSAYEVWLEYCGSGQKPENIPSRPDIVYRGRGWVSWCDWLGSADRPEPPSVLGPQNDSILGESEVQQ
jgi:hypothetical protein